MKATTTTRKTKAAKRTDRGVPFQEMRRLMHVYGSVKCLRKRQAPDGNAKIDSVKRKFYRWFPDLEERFEKDAQGFYQPKFGHEFEMGYREEMRREDGEVLAKKRASCRKKNGSAEGKTKIKKNKSKASNAVNSSPSSLADNNNGARVAPSIVSPVVFPRVLPDGQLSNSQVKTTEITLKFDQQDNDDPMVSSSAAITADTEPVDSCFIAEQGIFDDVEKCFYGYNTAQEMYVCPTVHECPGVQEQCPSFSNRCSISSSSSEETETEPASSSWDSDSPSIEDMLDKSIEECCEEILLSDDNDSMDDYLFDIISD